MKISSVGRRNPTITYRHALLPTESQWWAHAVQLQAHLALQIPQGGRSCSSCACCGAQGAGGCVGPGAVLLASRLVPARPRCDSAVCLVVLYCMEICAVLLCVISLILLASGGDSPWAPAGAGLGPGTAASLLAERCGRISDSGVVLRLRSWKVCRCRTSPLGLPGACKPSTGCRMPLAWGRGHEWVNVGGLQRF